MARDREPRADPVEAPENYPFPKTTDNLLSWSHAVRRLERASNYWLATARPDGRPHTTPVWGVWVDGALFFDGPPSTRWARNLASNPEISVHLESAEEVVILEGAVEDLVAEAGLAARIVEAWTTKYGRLLSEPATEGVFRLRPRTARAWSRSTLEDGTRWRFAGVSLATPQNGEVIRARRRGSSSR